MQDDNSPLARPAYGVTGATPAPDTAGAAASVDVLYLQEPGDASPISPDDINQDQIGDCYLLAAIGELALLHPNMIQNMIRVNADGTETVTLYNDADGSPPGFDTTGFAPVQVTVDNVFASDSVNSQPGQDVYAGQQEIWVQVLEKALATTVGGYGVVNQGGYPTLPMEQLTGQPASFYATSSFTLAQLRSDMAAGDLITFDTPQTTSLTDDPLVLDHAYMLGGLIDQGGTEMVQLLNPWGPAYDPAPIAFSQIAAYSDFVAVGQVVDDAPALVGAPPAPTGLALAPGGDSGTPGDDLTNIVTPTITGAAEAGDRITLFDGTNLAGSATAGADGRWSITVAALPDGTATFTATDTNATGVASTLSDPLSVTIDTAAPPAPTDLSAFAAGEPVDGPINPATALTITGSGVAGDVVTLRDGTAVVGTAVVGPGGNWSVQVTSLADGSHGFWATETDPAGNVSTGSTTLSLLVDAASAVTPLLQELVLDAAGDAVRLTGTAAVGATVQLYDDGVLLGSAAADAQTGSWSFGLPATLANAGEHRITATGTSVGGVVSEPSAALDIDRGASAGAETVSASAGGLTLIGDGGRLWYAGGIAPSSIGGGAGSDTIFSGSGGGTLAGGSAGGNVLVSQGVSGVSTRLLGAGDGDRLFGSTGGTDSLVAGSGRETLVGGGGPTTLQGGAGVDVIFAGAGSDSVIGGGVGGDTIVGGSGALGVTGQHGDAIFGTGGALSVTGSASGADSIIGGASPLSVTGTGGNMLVAAGSADASVQTGSGASLVFAGAGNLSLTGGAGAMQVVAGSGHAMIDEGTGSLTLQVVAGSAGGIEQVEGFRPGLDQIELFGFSPQQETVSLVGGSTLLALADGTQITLQGVTDLRGSLIQ